MQIEIDGWRFAVDVEHYSPPVAGTYSYTADSDVDYYGSSQELAFRVSDVCEVWYEEGSSILVEVSCKERGKLIYQYYSIIYNKVLEQMAVN
jgi:hypothetical protein